MSSTTRKHFNDYERRVLIELVDQKKAIIENHRTNGLARGEKNVCWEEICREFHSTPNVRTVSVEQLKNLYHNQKKKATRLANNERQSLYRTGGGPPSIPPEGKLDPLSERILSMAVIRNPLPSMKDGDAKTGSVLLDDEETEEIEFLVSPAISDNDDTTSTSRPTVSFGMSQLDERTLSSQLSATYSSQPAANSSSQPTAPLSSQPPAPLSSQPATPLSSQPAAPLSSQPAAPLSSQPAAPLSSQPAATPSSQPAASCQAETSGTRFKKTPKSTRLITAYHEKAKRRAPAAAQAADAIEQLSISKRKMIEDEGKLSEGYYKAMEKKIKSEVSLNKKLEMKIDSEVRVNELMAQKLELEIRKLMAETP